MGTNSIPSATTGTIIPATHHNSLKEALTTDLVPRDISGNPSANAGDLGSSSLPWLRMFFGLVSSGMSIEDAAGKMVLKINSSTKVTIGPNGIEAGSLAPLSVIDGTIASSSVQFSALKSRPITTNGTDPGLGGVSKSGLVSGSLNSNTSDFVITSTQLTVGTRPVILKVEYGAPTSGVGNTGYFNTSSNPSAAVRFRYNGVLTGGTNIWPQSLGVGEGWFFAPDISFINSYSPGVYTFELLTSISINSAPGIFTWNSIRLVAYEI